MENLNAEQVKTALECCSKDDCDNCPNGFGNCYSNLAKEALALIESQEKRIKKLTEEAEGLKQCIEHEHASFMETFGEYGEKCEKLTEDNEWCAKRILEADKKVKDYRQELAEVRVALAEANYDKKRLTEENDKLHASCTELARVQEENERLERICESYTLQYGTAADKEVFLKQERADTVHKMQERLKECFDNEIEHKSIYTESQVLFAVDQIAKEMLEGEI